MEKISAIIIDDERRSREALLALIQNYTTGVEIVGMADDVVSGVELVTKEQPQLVFLDIRMKTGTGFDFLSEVEEVNFQVIFTTAFDEYALKAFKFNAIDYLLKPVGIPELVQAIQKVQQAYASEKEVHRLKELVIQLNRFDEHNPTLTVSTENAFEFLEIQSIVSVQAQGAYSVIFLDDGKKHMTSKLLKDFENLLSDYHFFRIHHSHLVNMKHVKRYIKTDGGYVQMKDGTKIPVSRRKRDQFIKSFTSN